MFVEEHFGQLTPSVVKNYGEEFEKSEMQNPIMIAKQQPPLLLKYLTQNRISVVWFLVLAILTTVLMVPAHGAPSVPAAARNGAFVTAEGTVKIDKKTRMYKIDLRVSGYCPDKLNKFHVL